LRFVGNVRRYPTDKHGALIVPQEVKNLTQGHYRKISCRRDHQNESEYKFDFAWAKENCDDAHFVATAKKGIKVVITITEMQHCIVR